MKCGKQEYDPTHRRCKECQLYTCSVLREESLEVCFQREARQNKKKEDDANDGLAKV